MRSSTRHSVSQQGFGLVELMVGMVIGLIVTAVIYQVISNFEGVKRSTTSAAGAQVDAAFALSAIDRAVRAAGWGMPNADTHGCGVFQTYHDDGTTQGAVPGFPQTPVRIVDGGDEPGASDTITVLWGSSVRANVPNRLLPAKVILDSLDPAEVELHPQSGVALSGVGGFGWLADWNSVDNVTVCTLVRITASSQNPALLTSVVLSHAPAEGSAAAPNYNATRTWMIEADWYRAFEENPRLYDLGALTQRTFSVVDGVLQSQDYFSSSETTQLVSNVVALKAWYGISDDGEQPVAAWVRATAGAGGNWANPPLDDFKRIKAVRLAVVVRSPLKERADPEGACAVTTAAPVAWPGGPVIDLGNDPEWQCYRYRVFETVVPLRNVLWANLT